MSEGTDTIEAAIEEVKAAALGAFEKAGGTGQIMAVLAQAIEDLKSMGDQNEDHSGGVGY